MSDPNQKLPGDVGEPGVEPDGVASIAVLISGVVSTVIVVATILVATALYNQVDARLTDERVYAPKYMDAAKSLTDQLGSISEYAAPSNMNPHYQIPIEKAMDKVVAELGQAQLDANKTE